MKTATVIGGGISGVSSASMLRKHDYEVTIIDPRGIGLGTTSQSTEMIRGHHTREHELWCTEKTLQFVKENNLVTPLPYLFAYYDEEFFSVSEKQQHLGWDYGFNIEIFDQEESLRNFPFLRKQVKNKFLIGTTTCDQECRIDVNSLVQILFKNSKAKLVKDSVVRLEENGDVITLNNGIVSSDIVVVATGHWTGALLGNCEFGDYLNITPVPYYTLKSSGLKSIPYMVVLPDGLYFHPEHPANAEFAVGGISTSASYIPEILERKSMEAHIVKVNQYLQESYHLNPRCEALTAGCYDVTPSHSLIIEKSNINPKIVIFAGGNGHGIMMSIGAALLLEEELGLCNEADRKKMLNMMKEKTTQNAIIL